MKKQLYGFVLVISFFVNVGVASATTYNEVGDAGDSLLTAQSVVGGTDVIDGTLSTDVDMFSFYWGGGNFYVSTAGTTGWDSQLFLFDKDGYGIQANDDGLGFAGPAYLQVLNLQVGTYYLAVSAYNRDAYDTNDDLMFQSSPYAGLYGPLTSAALNYWSGSTDGGGDYLITFASFTSDGTIIDTNPVGSVPEPTTLLLFGTGLASITAIGRRKRN